MIKVYNVGSEAKSIVLIYPKKINTKKLMTTTTNLNHTHSTAKKITCTERSVKYVCSSKRRELQRKERSSVNPNREKEGGGGHGE